MNTWYQDDEISIIKLDNYALVDSFSRKEHVQVVFVLLHYTKCLKVDVTFSCREFYFEASCAIIFANI